MNDFPIIAEWSIRRIQQPLKEPRETYNERMKCCALPSIGLEGIVQNVFLYLEKVNMATTNDLTKHSRASAWEVQKHLDLLCRVGLINRIVRRLIPKITPKITDTLRAIVKVDSDSRSYRDFFCEIRGMTFSDIINTIATCKEIFRRGGCPTVKVVGVHGYSNKSIEVEGPVAKFGYGPQHMVVISKG